jgi:hypothetical protein
MEQTLGQVVDLRVVLRRGNRYALYFSARFTGTDLYCSGHARLPFPGFADVSNPLRFSYHQSGQLHHKARGERVGPARQETGLTNITGRAHIGGMSGLVEFADWTYVPKPDSRRRRNLILDLDAMSDAPWSIEFWAIEFWAIECGRHVLVEQTLEEQRERSVLLDHVLIDWTNPQLLLLAAAMRPEAWAALQHVIQTNSS